MTLKAFWNDCSSKKKKKKKQIALVQMLLDLILSKPFQYPINDVHVLNTFDSVSHICAQHLPQSRSLARVWEK
jgi:hypothetical protein